MPHQVFLCHSSRDKSVADAACAALEAQGIGCWIAPRDVLAGLEYGEAIIDAISGCQIVVLIFSGPANSSPQVRREIERAVSKEKTIVPFRIEDVLPSNAMEYALSNTHWLDALSSPVEHHLPELCRTVAALILRSPHVESLPNSSGAVAATAAARAIEVDKSKAAAPFAKRRWNGRLPQAFAAILLGISALAVVAAGVAAWLAPAKVTGPLDSTQITSSADFKQGPLFTDGARLYFNSREEPAEMGVSGGIIAPAHIFGPTFRLLDISADGSIALALSKDLNDETSRGTLWSESMLGGTPQKLSDHLALFGRWSPDGRSVVFADERTIFRMDRDGANLRKIWDAPQNVRDLSFSPDARRLSASVYTTETYGNSRLWELEVDGKNAHALQFEWPSGMNQFGSQWTPDGKHFVFRSSRDGRLQASELTQPAWFEFWKKPAAVRITESQLDVLGLAPARDSKGLFILGRPDQGAMQVLDPATGKFVPYLDGLAALNFVISPDRQWMAYSEYPTRFLWKSRLDGSERTQLSSSQASMPEWSPDGKWLTYTDWRNFYVVSAEGGGPKKLSPESKEVVPVMPTWLADGRSIAWSYYPFPDRPLTGIHVIEVASRKVSVMPGSEGYYAPSWSPDGKHLVAFAQNPSRMVLYTAATKTWKDLKLFDVEWGLWIWSTDSKSIYMSLESKGPMGIYRLTVPEGVWTRISGLDGVNDGDASTPPSLTPDGRPAVMSRTGIAQVYSLSWKP